MRLCSIIFSIFLCNIFNGYSQTHEDSFPVISWGGISAEKADTLYSLAKECGFNTHLGLYSSKKNAVLSMDAAARAGVGIIINFPQLRDSTEAAVALVKDHPALVAYHIKDEPVASDYPWLKDVYDMVRSLDKEHPCYINLLPNWYWGVDDYSRNLEVFASEFDLEFYSFDNYPVIEEEGIVTVRPEWYRNLEEFSDFAKKQGKEFWAFALVKAHSITEPVAAEYPEPAIGHIRLQVFSNLLYGAQAIQYFNFTGIVDPATCRKKPAFDIVRQVNHQIRAYSSVFHGCSVKGVWHIGDPVPSGTRQLAEMPHEKVRSIDIPAAVVSLIENADQTYLAVQNSSCISSAALDISFDGSVSRITADGPVCFDGDQIVLEPGDVAIFKL